MVTADVVEMESVQEREKVRNWRDLLWFLPFFRGLMSKEESLGLGIIEKDEGCKLFRRRESDE